MQPADQILRHRLFPTFVDKITDVLDRRKVILCLKMIPQRFSSYRNTLVDDEERFLLRQRISFDRVRVVCHFYLELLAQLGNGRTRQWPQPVQLFHFLVKTSLQTLFQQ